ncbi:DUF418 domain-containing protein [Brevibacillus borstelensis]|nr:DUF418 domain-containing protein [Brevibacillus borstelensis]MCC0566711.1 DUF418 domain-containing protein [Brevibacillus borstelensis]NOU56443.1 DUF418 domain-containing protein [Brevibacillus borstelensis]
MQPAESCWRMARFAMGPMEWLWRLFTYGSVPAFAKNKQ